MISVKLNCGHRFSAETRLSIQFESKGLVTAVYGPSGSGKTTILEWIAGVRSPCHGSIRIGERVVFDARQKINFPPNQRKVGMVFQDYWLFPHLTIKKNLLYGTRWKNQSGKVQLDEVIQVLGLESLLERYPKNLSGGERQRATLGRALLCEPELLLLDEPVSALDDDRKAQIVDFLLRVFPRWKIPTILVSHSKEVIQQLANWVVVLDQGRVAREGTPEILSLYFAAAGAPIKSNVVRIHSKNTKVRDGGCDDARKEDLFNRFDIAGR